MTAVPKVMLSADGPTVPRIVAGAMRLLRSEATSTAAGTARWIETALDLGIDLFDHADIYGGYRVEAHFGAALCEVAERQRVRVLTKCGIQFATDMRPQTRVRHYDTTPQHVRASVDRSLRNLGVEQIEILLIHRPDPLMDAPALGATLDALIDEGKIAYAGVSNFTPAQLNALQTHCRNSLVTNQVEHSLAHTNSLLDGTFDQCQALRIKPMLWSPLALDKTIGPSTPAGQKASIQRIADQHGVDPAIIVLAWAMTHPLEPVAVIGTTRPERLKAMASAASIKLDRQDWFDLYQAAIGVPIP